MGTLLAPQRMENPLLMNQLAHTVAIDVPIGNEVDYLQNLRLDLERSIAEVQNISQLLQVYTFVNEQSG